MATLSQKQAKEKELTDQWTERWSETHTILQEQKTLGLRKAGMEIHILFCYLTVITFMRMYVTVSSSVQLGHLDSKLGNKIIHLENPFHKRLFTKCQLFRAMKRLEVSLSYHSLPQGSHTASRLHTN